MLTTPFSGRARGCDVYAWLEKMVGREYYLNLKITKYNVEDPTKPVTISMAWSDESNTRKNAKTTLSNEGSE